MKIQEQIRQNNNDPAGMERLYQQAQRQKSGAEFAQAVQAAYTGAPDNLLYAAWYVRLQAAAEATRQILWKYAVPLAVLCGLVFWFVSSPEYTFIGDTPMLVFLAAPVAAAGVLAFLSLAMQKGYALAAGLAVGLLALTLYGWWIVPTMSTGLQDPTATLILIHLPVLSLAAVGVFLTGWRGSAERRFAFLTKTYEVATTGGLFMIAIAIFGGVTQGLFGALNVQLSDGVMRLIFAGGAGMLPVLAVAIIYNPQAQPEEQDFEQGLSKFLANLLRIMILPTLIVAVLYVFFIPFNFLEPFNNRDVLFIYNGMLFAVMALLVGATPLRSTELSARVQVWMRYAILGVAGLALLVSVYALAAILYRTFTDFLSMNRLTVIGWNVINIVVLGLLLVRQFGSLAGNDINGEGAREGGGQSAGDWSAGLKETFNFAAVAYTVWSAFLVLAIPLLYR